MDISKLHFVQPEFAKHAQAVLDFRRKFNAVNPELHGASELNAFSDSGIIGWFHYLNAPAGSNWFGYAKVADSTYLAMLDEVVVGIVNIRHELNDFLLQFGGHVGYSTHPDYQGRGIATAMLRFAVARLNELGVNQILITCDEHNIGSQLVISKNGGVLENTLAHPSNAGKKHRRYWIGNKD